MNIYPLYYSTSFNQFLTSDLYWIKQHMSASQQQQSPITPSNCTSSFSVLLKSNSITENDEQEQKKQQISTIDHYLNEIDHLFYEWNTIDIVLESIRNAFTIKENLTEEHLDEIDRELSIAYDDLMSQVRHLERRLKRMSNEINQKLIVQQQQQQQQQKWGDRRHPLTPTPSIAASAAANNMPFDSCNMKPN
jgi:chromosome segregation ATPase